MEKEIRINGQILTAGQEMALRVSLNNLYMEMQDPLALGDDEHGKAMTAGYRAQVVALLEIIGS